MNGRSAAFAALTAICPFDLMKFTLTYDGPLPSTGNSSKPKAVWPIRNQFHGQLATLWESNASLRSLERSAKVDERAGWAVAQGEDGNALRKSEHGHPVLPDGRIDLCGAIEVDGKSFRPLVRRSLHLACELDILFLRKEEPGALITQGGDIDNRIKTLFDALRMPSAEELRKGEPESNPLQCLLENDTLITGVSVRSDRLLLPTNDPKDVRLVIGVAVKVLRFGLSNAPLLGG